MKILSKPVLMGLAAGVAVGTFLGGKIKDALGSVTSGVVAGFFPKEEARSKGDDESVDDDDDGK